MQVDLWQKISDTRMKLNSTITGTE